jgi:hypothetical protein
VANVQALYPHDLNKRFISLWNWFLHSSHHSKINYLNISLIKPGFVCTGCFFQK